MDPAILPLPAGWERRYDKGARRFYFLDHTTQQTTWDDPRVAGAGAGLAPLGEPFLDLPALAQQKQHELALLRAQRDSLRAEQDALRRSGLSGSDVQQDIEWLQSELDALRQERQSLVQSAYCAETGAEGYAVAEDDGAFDPSGLGYSFEDEAFGTATAGEG
eukprot:RCo002672